MNDSKSLGTIRDLLLFQLSAAENYFREVIIDLTDEEYRWEPISISEQQSDGLRPVNQKRVWRVFEQGGKWGYDYTPELVEPPPFTTISWIMNHIAQTSEMYLYCIESEKPEGAGRHWEDLPVSSDRGRMTLYFFEVIGRVRSYLQSIPENEINTTLNKSTPAPWGEMRPAYKNLWGGIIEHTIEHTSQIAARKDRIRHGN